MPAPNQHDDDTTPLQLDFKNQELKDSKLRIQPHSATNGLDFQPMPGVSETGVEALLDYLTTDAPVYDAPFDQTNAVLSVLSKDFSQALFQKARQFLRLSPFFRWIIHLYAERKLLVFFGIHFISTMIVWGMCFVMSSCTSLVQCE